MDLALNTFVTDAMKLTISLAERGRYTISPDPLVAAVLIKDGKLMGFGYDMMAGENNAILNAIKMAQENAQGASLYTNIEVGLSLKSKKQIEDQLIAAQIKEIHIAFARDNFNKTIFESAGVKVFVGEEAQAAAKQNEIFFYFLKNRIPFVLASWGMSLDGKMALSQNASKGISGTKSLEHLHLIRNSFDAILVGTNTVMLDNPQLNVRKANPHALKNPIKLIIDRHGKLDENLNVFNQEADKTFVVITNHYPKSKQAQLQTRGIKFIELEERGNELNLNELLSKFASLSITSVLVEGGAKTLASFLKARLINGFHCYISPMVISGSNSLSPFQGELGVNTISDAKHAIFESVQTLGEDILIKGSFI